MATQRRMTWWRFVSTRTMRLLVEQCSMLETLILGLSPSLHICANNNNNQSINQIKFI